MEPYVSIVLPTYNRARALLDNFAFTLALEGVREIVVVDDGSTDDTPAVLKGWRDERLRLVRQPRNAGLPAARNLGAAVAQGSWVLFAEDDCRFPPDYALILREEAEAHRADIVGAPMVWAAHEQELEAELAAARARGEGPNGLDEVAGFPRRAVVTPLLPATALVRRAVFDHVRFDEGYRGNAYREDTDFFIRATRCGFTCLLTPRTFFWEAGRWEGGCVSSLLRTEYWTARNNWRFLRRHGRWLVEGGYISSPLREQLAFVARRAHKILRPPTGAKDGSAPRAPGEPRA